MRNDDTVASLLLSYVALLAARNAYGPGDGFEFKLWDAVVYEKTSDLISDDERKEILYLLETTHRWVTYDREMRMFELIDGDDWLELRAHA